MKISDLPNLGKKSQAMLAQAGIVTARQLRELGAVAAFIQVKRCSNGASLNLLWAIEGALSGRHWQDVAKHDRLRLLLELEQQGGSSAKAAAELEDLPSIGKSIAADLRSVGVSSPQQLAKQEPLTLYLALIDHMGRRCDPCVLYTLMAARHFLQTGEALRWWKFTAAGKQLLASHLRGKK